mmetsp:Transcript_8229/g.22658  ORF Transcript_8229/g.22658 Transcript_8229/m.22658 type:complete len:175 (+) Transcript_8229:75-599(+)
MGGIAGLLQEVQLMQPNEVILLIVALCPLLSVMFAPCALKRLQADEEQAGEQSLDEMQSPVAHSSTGLVSLRGDDLAGAKKDIHGMRETLNRLRIEQEGRLERMEGEILTIRDHMGKVATNLTQLEVKVQTQEAKRGANSPSSRRRSSSDPQTRSPTIRGIRSGTSSPTRPPGT